MSHFTTTPQTEQRNPLSTTLDVLPTVELCRLINRQDAWVPVAVAEVLPAIATAADHMVETLSGGGRIFYQGAGTSGRLGVLDASELLPTYNLEPGRVIPLIAGGHTALTESIEAAEDDPDQGKADLARHSFAATDLLIGIAASGQTPYVLGGMRHATELGAATVALVCAPASPMAGLATVAIELLTGPEVVTGSTRMKAGTGQKLVLNMLSTAAMVRMGKVYGNLMVDVRPTNEKLRRRAVRIVADAACIDEIRALTTLNQSEWEVKTAVVMGLLNVSAEEARRNLSQNRGHVRRTVEATR